MPVQRRHSNLTLTLPSMAGIAWKSGAEVVVATSSSAAWKTTSLSCGTACTSTCQVVSRLLECVERWGCDVRATSKCSSECREALLQCLEDVSGKAEAVAEQVNALLMIWELCEAIVLAERQSLRGRLILWLRAHCVDWATEAEEYHRLVGLFRMVSARRGAPEAWRPAESRTGPSEASSPFWHLVFRLLRRGLTHEAWTVLEQHSTSERLRVLWAPIGSLLREMPQPPATTDDTFGAYEDSRRRWLRRAGRVRKAALRGDAELVSTVPPLRAVLALLTGASELESAPLESDCDVSESRLLAGLLYSDAEPEPLLRDALQARSDDAAVAARRELLRACLANGLGGPCVRAAHSVGTDVACAASAAILAKLCDAAGKLAEAPPPRPAHSDLEPKSIVKMLALELADRLEVVAGWRISLKCLTLLVDDSQDAKLAVLQRAKPIDDSDCIELARTCIAARARPEACALLSARGALYLAVHAYADAAKWFARAELATRTTRCAVDGALDRLCKRAIDDVFANGPDALSIAHSISSGIDEFAKDDHLNNHEFFAGTHADLLGRLLKLLDLNCDRDAAATALRDLLLERPPTDKSHVSKILARLPDALPNDRLLPLDLIGILHRLFESTAAALDYGPHLDPTCMLDLRYKIALSLADAFATSNSFRRSPVGSTPAVTATNRSTGTPPPAFSRNATDLLNDSTMEDDLSVLSQLHRAKDTKDH